MMFLQAYDGTSFPLSNHQRDRVGECGEGGPPPHDQIWSRTPAITRSEQTLELSQNHDVGYLTGREGDVGDECEHPSMVPIEEEHE
jgi:hypothetical protein